MQLTAEMRQAADSVWEGWHRHPVVKGIGDGTLPLEKFQYWLRQDYVYLKDYARVFALGAAKAEDLETMSTFAGLLDGTLNTEMGLHRKYAARFGISEAELENETPAPTTQAYTDFFLARSYGGDMTELMAALLPCTWGFYEIALRLKEAGGMFSENPYRDWIEMYTSDEYVGFYDWTRELMERMLEECSPDKRRRLTEIFITSSRYEYLFWDMVDEMQTWPILEVGD